ncbi:MAG: transglycosylase SLT domain-containing protein [Ignavibacteriae bacterium]|nr:transglycosylase SLT domain-containing protein [Ignavibacteriota bacterium]
MKTFLLFLSALILMAGCSPFSEKAAQRTDETGIQLATVTVATTSPKPVGLDQLDFGTRQILRSYGPTIRTYSAKYGFDWRLTLAIIKAESNFLDSAESHRGAAGLMQIMPETQEELAKALEIDNIAEPQGNIHAGLYYLSKMNRFFRDAEEGDRLRLTLAAYNAGPGRVFDAQKIARYLNNDPNSWEAVRDALPMLSKRYYSLHDDIWPDRRPSSGQFRDHRQTIAYVERIIGYYDSYRLMLN